MIKKHGMPPSALYVQSVTEQHNSLAGKVGRAIGEFEKRRVSPDAWQSNQLNYAIDYIADGLYSLAICELDALEEQRQMVDKDIDGSYTSKADFVAGLPPISIFQLRQKLQNLTESR
jgi:hypothetical protein